MKKKRSKISYRELRDATPGDVPNAPPAPAAPPAHPETPEELAARLNRRELPAAPPQPLASTAAPRMKRGDPAPRARGIDAVTSTPPGRVPVPSSGSAATPSDASPSRNAHVSPADPRAGSSAGASFAQPSPVVPAPGPTEASLREQLRQADARVDLLMFRVGGEIFAASLGSVEEVVEMPDVHRLPEMPDSMLGVFKLRSRLVPVYAPRHVLGVELIGVPAAALVLRSALGRIALAVNDVDDVLVLPAASFRDAPGTGDADGVLLGVASRGRDLVAIVDADALVAACVTEGITEFS